MKILSISILVFLLSSNVSDAQILKKIKEKVQNIATGTTSKTSENEETSTSNKINISEIKAKVENHQIQYGSYTTNVVSSPAHAKFMKQVVFSNTEIKFKKEDVTKFKNKFNINEPVNIQFYLERTVADQTSEYLNLGLGNLPQVTGIIYVDNKIVGDWVVSALLPGHTGFNSWTTNGYGLSTTEVSRQTNAALAWTNALSDIAVGTHVVKIEIAVITFYTTNDKLRKSYSLNTAVPEGVTVIKDVMSTGEMTLNVTAQGKVEFAQKYGIKPPTAAQKNAVLEKEMKALVEAQYNDQVMKVVILDPQWGYNKNVYGVIVSRYVYGLTISKNTEGVCEGSVFMFTQDKGEGKNYGSTYISAVSSANEWTKPYTCGSVK